MKHPSKEQWMEFVYGEAANARELRAHLGECAECQRAVEGWRGTMGALDSWTAKEAPARERSVPWVRWAAAAAVFVGVGIAIGASARKGPDVTAMQQTIAALEERAEKDRAATVAALQELETRRVSDLIAMRRDLERVAVATDAGLKLTQSQLVQLASYPDGAAR